MKKAFLVGLLCLAGVTAWVSATTISGSDCIWVDNPCTNGDPSGDVGSGCAGHAPANCSSSTGSYCDGTVPAGRTCATTPNHSCTSTGDLTCGNTIVYQCYWDDISESCKYDPQQQKSSTPGCTVKDCTST